MVQLLVELPIKTTKYATEKAFRGNMNTILNHLLYLDILKLTIGNKNHFQIIVEIVESFSKGVLMVFGLGKCCTPSIVR